MELVLLICIAAAILFAQKFLSELKHWQFGGILPLCAILFTIWCFYFRNPPLDVKKSLLPFIVLICFLFAQCAEGRKKLKKEQKQELEKMKANDIDTKK